MEAKIIAMAAADSVFAFTQLHYNQGVHLVHAFVFLLSNLSDVPVAAMTFLTWDALVHISVEVRRSGPDQDYWY